MITKKDTVCVHSIKENEVGIGYTIWLKNSQALTIGFNAKTTEEAQQYTIGKYFTLTLSYDD